MMSIYLRLFPRSNSSFFLCSGNALQSEVLRLREEIFLVDAGLGTPRICMQDEPTGVINRRLRLRFENKVGSHLVVVAESPIIKIFERFFIDLLVAGESLIKERAARLVGEPLLPRRFRQNRAWMELNRTNTKVKGFLIHKNKGGYSVAIAGFITFLPFRRLNKRISNDRFTTSPLRAEH